MASQTSVDLSLKEEISGALTLPGAFSVIEKCDKVKDYKTRTIYVYHALALAAHLGLECGIRFDLTEKDGDQWPVVVIKLPQGEVAWHNEAFPCPYDGHTVEQKYERIRQYNASVSS